MNTRILCIIATCGLCWHFRSQRRVLSCIHSTHLVTALSQFREQCTFTWRPWILKCLEATRNWYHISPIWQVFSPGEEVVNWFDLRWRQNSAATVEHETEWNCYSLPICLACRDLHHPHPRAFCTLPSFARIKRPRWRPVGLNDPHPRSQGKIGDSEQSNILFL